MSESFFNLNNPYEMQSMLPYCKIKLVDFNAHRAKFKNVIISDANSPSLDIDQQIRGSRLAIPYLLYNVPRFIATRRIKKRSTRSKLVIRRHEGYNDAFFLKSE